MIRTVALVTACLLFACKSKPSKDEATAPTGSAASAAGSGSGGALATASAAATVKPKTKAPPTKQQLAEFRKHMKAGWAAQKQHKWADATTEFEAAVKLLDGDQRALSELGWSAMNAGDYVKARKADVDAVHVALDPKVKAASLYNLGMVQLKTGDKDGARRSFITSLELRPNKIVEAELGKLGAAPTAEAEDGPICDAGTSPCDCAMAAADSDVDRDDPDRCKESTDVKLPVPGWKVFHVRTMRGTEDWLMDDKAQAIALVGKDEDRMRSSSSASILKLELKPLGGHQILWIEVTDESTSDYMDDANWDTSGVTMTSVTVCALGDGKTATRCVRDLPHTWTRTEDHQPMNEEGDPTGKGTHSESAVETEITLADEGTVNVRLVKGSGEWLQSELGPHKLW